MTHEDILKKLTEVIQDQLDLDDLQLSASTKAVDVEGWDSLAHVRIMISVEQAFGMRFQTAQITGVSNVGELVELIAANT